MTSSPHCTRAHRLDSAFEVVTAKTSLSAVPPSPQLYSRQWLPDPAEGDPIVTASNDEGRAFFQSLEELVGMAYVKSEVLDVGMLEEVLAQMQHDRKTYDRQELKNRIANSTSTASSTLLHRTKASIKKEPRDEKRPPPPSLAATHPANYQQRSAMGKKPKTCHPEDVELPPNLWNYAAATNNARPVVKTEDQADTSPPSKNLRQSLQHIQHKVQTEQDTIPPWKLYTDPMRAYSGTPNYPDPKPRHLVSDTRSDIPSVLSPVFCVGLPLGSVIEVANPYYPDDRVHS